MNICLPLTVRLIDFAIYYLVTLDLLKLRFVPTSAISKESSLITLRFRANLFFVCKCWWFRCQTISANKHALTKEPFKGAIGTRFVLATLQTTERIDRTLRSKRGATLFAFVAKAFWR